MYSYVAPRSNEAVGAHITGPPRCERALIFAELAGALKLQAVSTELVAPPIFVFISLGTVLFPLRAVTA